MVASSPADADVRPQQKYDVFLSFRGEDTRHKFTSHLHAALGRKKIYTYIDYRLERGDEIGPSLLTAIEQSKLSVIIFSKDYASSSWCLDEVVHILKCKQAYGQLVIPVFYDIDPSHVRRQQGTYADAFAILEERFEDNIEKVSKWRDALTTAANLSGVHSQNIRLESELVETIVKDILMKLNRNSSYVVKGLVGMESHIRQIELLLCINTQDVCYRTIGIWGMGGTGKTTLADAVFHRNSIEFDACLFLANVREKSEKHGPNHLRNKLLQPGKRRRLWHAEDAYQVLHNNTGTSTVKAIFLDVSKIREIQLSTATFKNMHDLKLLKFYVPQKVHEERKRQRTSGAEEKQLSSFPWLPGLKAVQSFLAKSRVWGSLKLLDVYYQVCNYDDKVFNEYCKVYVPGGLESLPEELRYLYWEGYPLKSLPSQYSPENLVELHLPHSQVKQLWNNVQNLGNLKYLNLSHSQHLTQVPDLSGSSNIERINLSGCTSLVEVPSYFQNLENLTYLDLQKCTNLKKIWELPCNLEELKLCGTAIEEISPSIWSHEKLRTLNLNGCRFLKNLPSSSSSNAGKLESLLLNNCSVLESVPDSIYNSYCLEALCLSGCEKLKRLPPLSVGRLCCLRRLYLDGCRVLESIPDSLLSLSTLNSINLSETMIESIPSGIINASELRYLCLTNCKKLKVIPELPWQLGNLLADGCTSLKSVASSRSALMEQPWVPYEVRMPDNSILFRYAGYLIYTNCLELDESTRSNIMGDAQLKIMRIASSSSIYVDYGSFLAICPGNEIPRWFGYDYDYEWEGCELNNIQFPPDWFPKTKTTGKGPMKEIGLNFVVSAVVVANSEYTLPSNCSFLSFQLICDCNFKTNNDGKGHTRVRYTSPGFMGRVRDWTHWRGYNHFTFEEDHVVTFFESELFLCEENSITQASFHVFNIDEDRDIMTMKLIRLMHIWASVRCGIAEPSGVPAPMGQKTTYSDVFFEKAFMTLFARKMKKFAAPVKSKTEIEEKKWWEYDYESFVDVSKRVMHGRSRLQQQ
ncbi:hypothetical protein M0R45_010391 [Rubus argutus]|uniref:TIR domain-containing protein n=1 Tax=Rubus argutus TaxID=59490 RepID=A0AAW1Y6X8_RUBAR